jgi:hypothetical protein
MSGWACSLTGWRGALELAQQMDQWIKRRTSPAKRSRWRQGFCMVLDDFQLIG